MMYEVWNRHTVWEKDKRHIRLTTKRREDSILWLFIFLNKIWRHIWIRIWAPRKGNGAYTTVGSVCVNWCCPPANGKGKGCADTWSKLLQLLCKDWKWHKKWKGFDYSFKLTGAQDRVKLSHVITLEWVRLHASMTRNIIWIKSDDICSSSNGDLGLFIFWLSLRAQSIFSLGTAIICANQQQVLKKKE